MHRDCQRLQNRDSTQSASGQSPYGQRKLNKVLNGVAIAAGVVCLVALGHFGNYFGIALTIGSFVVLIGCLILAHLLGSDEDANTGSNPVGDANKI